MVVVAEIDRYFRFDAIIKRERERRTILLVVFYRDL